jgi:lauroyl/myristoyl acyltransferase
MTGVMKDRLLNRVIKKIRSFSGVKIVSNVRSLINRLNRSTITGFMLDNTRQGKMIELVTQGLKIRLPALAFSVSQKIGAGVVPVFCYLEHGCLKLRVFPAQDAAGCAQVLLKMVQERPAEWVFWGKAGAIKREGE